MRFQRTRTPASGLPSLPRTSTVRGSRWARRSVWRAPPTFSTERSGTPGASATSDSSWTPPCGRVTWPAASVTSSLCAGRQAIWVPRPNAWTESARRRKCGTGWPSGPTTVIRSGGAGWSVTGGSSRSSTSGTSRTSTGSLPPARRRTR